MTDLFVLGLIGFTSTGAALINIRTGRSTRTLIAGVAEALEVVGAGLVFFAVNLLTGVGALLLARVVAAAPAPPRNRQSVSSSSPPFRTGSSLA